MNKLRKILILFMIIDAIVIEASNSVENEIKSKLISKYGQVYGYINSININDEKDKHQEWIFPITDPYGTLEDCYVFLAKVNGGGLIGVYKNNNIIWDSGPLVDLLGASGDYDILGSLELNNDNKVEILAYWLYGVSGFIQNIWIFSWDGQTGELLNETIPGFDENTFRSVIWSFDYVTEIFDIDGDGIEEIKGVDRKNTGKSKLYSWNGSKYGDFGVKMPDYVPMNLLTAKVSCKVSKSQYGLLYNYTVENDSTSKQKIWNVVIDKPFEDIFANSSAPNKKWSMRGGVNKIKWDVSEDLQNYPFDYISSGNVQSNFRIETSTPMVSICNYFLQGKNGKKIYKNQYIKENSFKGKTICGKPAPDTLVYTNFLDTLITYTDSSYSLGWIKNEQKKDKYNTYFTNAKNYLNQNNNNAAKTELQKVLTDCNTDSSTTLTSEAYALLYFNTDYLINKIPEREQKDKIKQKEKD